MKCANRGGGKERERESQRERDDHDAFILQ